MSQRNHVSRAAGLVVIAKSTGRCLFPLRSEEVTRGGTWGTWGGKVEEGESFEDAAIRELREECGYDGPFLAVKRLPAWESPAFVYANHLAIVPEEFEPWLNWETSEARWIPFHEAPYPRHDGLQMLLDLSEVHEAIAPYAPRRQNPTPTDDHLRAMLKSFEKSASDFLEHDAFEPGTPRRKATREDIELLDAMEPLVDRIYKTKGKDIEARDAFKKPFQVWMLRNTNIYAGALRTLASKLFMAILEARRLTPDMTKKVHAAVRFWSRTRVTAPALAPYGVKHLREYFDIKKALITDLPLARAAVEQEDGAKLCATKDVAVGRFVLKNAGCFSDEVMKHAEETLREVERGLGAIGYASLCYGDVILTRQAARKAHTAAFYMTSDDKVYIRADKWQDERTSTLYHELGHRLVLQTTKQKGRVVPAVLRTLYDGMFTLYTKMLWDSRPAANDELRVPYKGDILDLTVKFVEPSDGGGMVHVAAVPKGYEGRPLHMRMPLAQWVRTKDPAFSSGGFVTEYAKKNPEENFCELFTAYALGTLREPWLEVFEATLSALTSPPGGD